MRFVSPVFGEAIKFARSRLARSPLFDSFDWRWLFVIALPLLSSACVSVLPDANPAAPRFGINDVEASDTTGARIATNGSALMAGAAHAGAASKAATTSWSLTIDDPIATRGIDTVKIARIEDGQRYEYYDDAEWLDRAPLLFETALIRSFQNSGSIISVGGISSQPIADYILKMDIRSFSAEETDDGVVAKVDVYVRLSDFRARNYAARRFQRAIRVRSDNGVRVATQLDKAVSQVIPQIIDWTLTVGEKAELQKKGSS
ncbi:MAG: ABC-type transport auxiliary lipoprotein family protein [Pseudomonadota bacterium]